jgi:hypothetical protein
VFDGLDVAEISRCTVELATEGLAPGHRHPSLQSRATWSRRSAPAMRCGRRKHLPNSLSNVPAAPQFLLWDFSCHPGGGHPGCAVTAVPQCLADGRGTSGRVNRPCTMALMLHGTAAGLYGGVGQRPPPSESHPSTAARARSASGVSAKLSPARHRCAPLGPPGSGQAWPVEPPVVMPVARMLAMSQDNRPFPGSPHLATPLGWRCVNCGVHLVPTFGRPAGPELVRWSSPGRGSLLPR